MIADKVAVFDVVIVHVGTNNTVDSVSVCIDKYRQLAQGLTERNPMVHVAFSAILPRGQNQYCPWEAQPSWLNDNYIKVNAALMQYSHECGFTFLGGLVDDWPSYLNRDGVHSSRFGNKVLADYLYQEACTLSIHLERSHIQQCYKETQAPSSWTGWTRQDSIPAISEADFPPLGLHIFISSHAASGPSTAPAPVWKASTAPLQRHDTNQPTRTLQSAGFSLVGGAHGRCKVESLSLLLLEPRHCLCGDVDTLNHILWGCPEDPPPTDLISPPPTDEQWEAVLSSTDRDIQTRVLARAEDAIVKHSLAAYVAYPPLPLLIIKLSLTHSTVSGSKLEGQASASRDAICDSFGKVQHVASRQNKECLEVATAKCRPVINGVPNDVTVCKCCRPGTMQDGGQIMSTPGAEAGTTRATWHMELMA
ncbi:hypothetical protein HPB49_005261 [Dermacentor silvarum]|uniref:Uncharacterized protein n=1 Tax=Dermacentor silvarum TaxID=543639 RepID=A0ACB8DV07_DERSI|nr:hypothetical protein HPB49_005261 [Dermacentor silvarum]